MKPILSTIFCGAVLCGVSLAQEKPNIIILFSDDAGYADFGFQPNCEPEMKDLTPRIDTIAADGVRFTSAYVTGSVCSPSRAGLMTGRYQERFGFDNNLPPGAQSGVDLGETFGINYLNDLGYETGIIGKWHLGYPKAYHPNARGFDYSYTLLQGSRPYFPMKNVSPMRVLRENGVPTPEVGYVTDRIGDAACRFIETNKDEPFFLFVSFTAPHSPNQFKEEDADRIAHIKAKRRHDYAGLMVSLDDNVGKVLDCLKQQDLTDNTLVIFTNDNGGQTQTGAVNTPLNGSKGSFWEGGVRVPMAMRWPGHITAGGVVNEPVITLDFIPTFVELAGGEIKDEWMLDGVSMAGQLKGTNQAAIAERPLFWRAGGKGGKRAMRWGQWKVYDQRGGEEPLLFDLSQDVSEANNLALEEPQQLELMLGMLNQWESELVAPHWGPGSKGRRAGTSDSEQFED